MEPGVYAESAAPPETATQREPATGSRSATATWALLIAVGLAIAIGQGSTTLIVAPLSLYLRALGAPADRIGLEVGASGVLATVCTLGVGPLINRWGPKPLLLMGMGAYLLAAVGMFAIPSEAAATCFRALQGVGAALVLPSGLTLVPRLIPMRPGAAIGAVGSIYTLATAIGPPLGLWLYGHGGRSSLFLPAAGCAAAGLGLCALLPRVGASGTRSRGFGYERRWTRELVANALCNAYFGGIAAYLPLVLAHPSAPNAGIFFTADALGVLLLRAPTGMLVDRSGPRMAEVIGVAMTLAGIGALFLPDSTLTLIVAGAGTGTGAGLFLSAVLVSLTQRSGEHNRGTAMALGSASFNVGLFAGGALSGLLVGPGGFDAVLALGLATTVAGLPLVLFERREPTPGTPVQHT
jgi:MFS family permease